MNNNNNNNMEQDQEPAPQPQPQVQDPPSPVESISSIEPGEDDIPEHEDCLLYTSDAADD